MSVFESSGREWIEPGGSPSHGRARMQQAMRMAAWEVSGHPEVGHAR